jgi:hypothetical protein
VASNRPRKYRIGTADVFYTVDDGETWFVDSSDRIPPFEHDGKMAVRANLFICTKDGTIFPAFLMRYSDEVIQAIKSGEMKRSKIDDRWYLGQEVKKPRSPGAAWINRKQDQAYFQCVNNFEMPEQAKEGGCRPYFPEANPQPK